MYRSENVQNSITHTWIGDDVYSFVFSRSRRPGNVRIPSFRLEVVDCCSSTSCVTVDWRTDAFLVLDNDNLPHRSHVTYNSNYYSPPTAIVGGRGRVGSAGGNRWVKSRLRKTGTVRFFDDGRARFRDTDTGKTVQ